MLVRDISCAGLDLVILIKRRVLISCALVFFAVHVASCQFCYKAANFLLADTPVRCHPRRMLQLTQLPQTFLRSRALSNLEF